jgi:hypothetical protein
MGILDERKRQPSPSMGEGWVGVSCETRSALCRTAPPPTSPLEGEAFLRCFP